MGDWPQPQNIAPAYAQVGYTPGSKLARYHSLIDAAPQTMGPIGMPEYWAGPKSPQTSFMLNKGAAAVTSGDGTAYTPLGASSLPIITHERIHQAQQQVPRYILPPVDSLSKNLGWSPDQYTDLGRGARLTHEIPAYQVSQPTSGASAEQEMGRYVGLMNTLGLNSIQKAKFEMTLPQKNLRQYITTIPSPPYVPATELQQRMQADSGNQGGY